MNEFNKGTPVLFVQILLSDSVITLEKSGYSYAVVQFVDDAGSGSGANKHIATYNLMDDDPDQDPSNLSNGFKAGDQDKVVFSNAELRSGVKILNATNGSPCVINVQYYTY